MNEILDILSKNFSEGCILNEIKNLPQWYKTTENIKGPGPF